MAIFGYVRKIGSVQKVIYPVKYLIMSASKVNKHLIFYRSDFLMDLVKNYSSLKLIDFLF